MQIAAVPPIEDAVLKDEDLTRYVARFFEDVPNVSSELNRILVLKELGFNLDQVRDILRSKVNPSELRNMLVLRRNDVEQTLALEAQRLQQIETRIAHAHAFVGRNAEGHLPIRTPLPNVSMGK